MTSQTNGETTGAELCPFPEEPLLLLDFGCKRRNKEERNSHPAVYRQDSCLQDRYLFLYTFHGTGICERKGNSHTLLPGTGFLSDCPWEESYYTSDESWEYLYICFEGPTARPFCGKILKDFGPVFSLPSDSMPIQLWMNLRKDQDRGRRLRPYEGGEMMYRFLSSLLRTLETFTPPLLPPAYVETGISYMKEHLAENFSIAALAETLQVTPAYFTRLFVRQTGQSPISYLTDLRITYALSLLADTSCSVSMISRECGFSCRNYFCKVFRKAQGCSPIEYRKRIRQEREALSDQENCQSV